MTPPPEDPVRKRSSADYVFGKVIGDGSFSTVYLARDIHNNKEFAIKVLEKRHIIREKKMEYVLREKKVLQMLSGCTNYFVKLYCTFQDTERLYFVLTYAKNGDLLPHINKNGSFTIACTQYYAAELVLGLEVLHSKGIIHRDLKPENILFDENWHILITDFGSAKIQEDKADEEDENNKRRKNSFVGTAQYVSPEVLRDSESFYSSDLWAVGCIIYQMISGLPPFRAGTDFLIFQKIKKLEYEFPEGFHQPAKDLVEKLLVLNPSKRLGAADTEPYSSVRQHEFFNGIDWDNLGPPPKITPYLPTCSETENKTNNQIPEHLEPGLNCEKEAQLHFDMICQTATSTPPVRKKSETNRSIMDIDNAEVERRLELQRLDKWHNLVEGNLILKQGLVDKRKGLFARRRMLLLTRGPRLYYVDPATMVLKGEIPWSADLRTEPKNFKIFFVHTPNRTYYLEDPEGYALEWCKAIDEVRAYYYPQQS